MKKTIALLGVVGLVLLGGPRLSHAQAAGATSAPFADVPADHWAYQAVDTLQKAGIIVGYPDATYGGKRALSRYEFSAALNRSQFLINGRVDMSPYPTKDDLNVLRDNVNTKIAADAQAVDALRARVNGLRPTLSGLGQSEAAAKSRLDALERRQGKAGGKR